MFSIRIFDRDRHLLAVLDRISTWTYTRKPSQATEITVSVPYEVVRDQIPVSHPLYAFLAPAQVTMRAEGGETPEQDPLKLQHAQIANLLQVWEGNELRVSGRITTRDVAATTVTVRALTEEILLERNLCPAQYGRVFDNWDLADVARHILKGWHVERVKSRGQWAAAIEASNADINTEPGLVLLTKDGCGRYHSEGHITLRFMSADFPDFAGWDRIRWASDNQEPVTTSMQYRYGDDPASMGAWSDEFVGAFPDELGVAPGTADAGILDVRINLRTSDTEQEDPSGKPVGQTPAVFAVEVVARTPAAVQVGDVPASAGVQVKDLEADNDTALAILIDACEQVGWEFEVVDGQLNLAPQIGADRRSEFVFREGTNTRIDRLRDDDSELTNVLYAVGPGDGLNRMQLVLRDEGSIAAYDVHPKTVEFDVDTEADLVAKAQTYLEEHRSPVQGFDIQDQFAALGSSYVRPEYGAGDRVRVVDPRSGTIFDSRIMEHTRSYSPRGLRITNRLGKPRATLVDREARVRGSVELGRPRVSVTPAIEGIVVRVPAPASRAQWASTEVHLSTSAGFTPGPETLQDTGRRTRFELTGLAPGTRYHCRARFVSTEGTPSPYSEERSVVAGDVLPPDLGLDDLEDYRDPAVPAAPVGLGAIPAFKAFAVFWGAVSEPRIDHYVLRYATSPDGQTWGAWTTLEAVIRSTYHVHQALDPALRYQYQVRAVSLAGVAGEWSDEYVAGAPGKASLSEDVVDQLAREHLGQDVQTELDGLGLGLTDAAGRLAGAEERLDGAEGRLSSAEASITELDGEIALKATQSDVDTLSGTVSDHSATLLTHATAIAARVTQSVFDVLEGRVTDNEATLTTHATAIAARVTQTVFETLEGRVTSAEGTLQVHATDIAARVTTTVFDSLEGRVTTTESDLTLLDDAITAAVSRITDSEAFIAAFTLGPEEISSTVTKVMPGGELHTTIQQSAEDIAQRVVKKGEVVAEINASEEGVRIAGDKILLDGNTQVAGDFQVDGNLLVGGTVTWGKMESASFSGSSSERLDLGTSTAITISHAALNFFIGMPFLRFRVKIGGQTIWSEWSEWFSLGDPARVPAGFDTSPEYPYPIRTNELRIGVRNTALNGFDVVLGYSGTATTVIYVDVEVEWLRTGIA
jgi:hypothetical protein